MKKHYASFIDFQNFDLRVGKVVEAKILEQSRKLIELRVDLGEDYETVSVLAGLAEFYSPDDFIGKTFLFVANLEPKEMAGSTSNGMMLAADSTDMPVLLEMPSNLAPGTVIR